MYIMPCTHMRMQICIYACMYACTYVHMYVCMYVCMYMDVDIRIHRCMYKYDNMMYVRCLLCVPTHGGSRGSAMAACLRALGANEQRRPAATEAVLPGQENVTWVITQAIRNPAHSIGDPKQGTSGICVYIILICGDPCRPIPSLFLLYLHIYIYIYIFFFFGVPFLGFPIQPRYIL